MRKVKMEDADINFANSKMVLTKVISIFEKAVQKTFKYLLVSIKFVLYIIVKES